MADPVRSGSLQKQRIILGRGPASRLYMATLATCSSSLAIRRSWRMTRSLSDLNSRSTSSSLSSIFWSNTERELARLSYSASHLTIKGSLDCLKYEVFIQSQCIVYSRCWSAPSKLEVDAEEERQGTPVPHTTPHQIIQTILIKTSRTVQ